GRAPRRAIAGGGGGPGAPCARPAGAERAGSPPPRAGARWFRVRGARGPAGAGEPPGGDAIEARREAQLALAAVLRRLSELRPVVLWIDDLQWADYESMLFLEAAIAGAATARILVVLGPPSTALPSPDRDP